MRALLPSLALLAALAGAFAAGAFAGDDEPPTPERLHARIQALEAEVRYLLARDEATTAYLLAHTDRAKAFATALQVVRDQGFTAGAIPAPSREALLAALEEMGKGILKGLPEVTKEQQKLLEQAKQHR